MNPAARSSELEEAPALLPGWSRDWTHRISTARGKVCALTVRQAAGESIMGVVLAGNSTEHFEIDEREIGYERVPVTVHTIAPNVDSAVLCSLYVGKQRDRGPATHEYPIWRSYLDCVLAGYLKLGGKHAVEGFINSTHGWPAPILDDRNSPRYPRAVSLTVQERGTIDSILRKHLLLTGMFS